MGNDPLHTPDLAHVERERDLYVQLLTLGRQEQLTPLLQEALALIVELGDARQGYLELYDEDAGSEPRWWIAHGFSDDQVQYVRTALSTGIIAEALATGHTIATQSAIGDPQFQALKSVHSLRIEAVLCAPIGEDPPAGVLYLQGPANSRLASSEGRTRAEMFARHLASLANRLLAEYRRTRAEDPTRPLRESLRLTDVVGRSAAFAAVLKQAALVAPLDVPVLLTGESGTGKSQLARVIHDNSPRAAHPFVELNCAALPETLMESELFGALPGAHSTATRRMDGKVAAAEHGTLLLDEIGDITPAAQAKLLQLLQSKQYYPLGAAKPMHADVRIIAATNADLERAVAERRFREDLFYRLQVLPLRVPALAERHDDVRELAAFFCAKACARYGLAHLELSRDALRAAEAAEWPGNVRQLQHAVEAAAIRASGEGALQVERSHLFPEATPASRAEPAGPLTFQAATRHFQKGLLAETLAATDWNITEAARRLDIARAHVYNLIRAFGLQRAR